jgi:RNA polymerase sigma-70 factor (ECF subfamily)
MGKEHSAPRGSRRAARETMLASLMRSSQNGDAGAYARLLEELAMHLRSFLPHALHVAEHGDDGACDDLVQDILCAVHEKRHTYDPALPFLPWFYGLCRHKVVDRLRAKGSYRRLLDRWAEAQRATPASGPAAEAALDAEEALGFLPARQREVLALTKGEGLSVREAAARSGLSEANVKVLTFRAIRAVRRHFGRHDA